MLGVGIVGAGFFGGVHARAVTRHPDLRVAAVCSRDPRDAAKLAGEYDALACDDWQALIDAPEVDAIVIATPHHLHVDVAIAALDAGKHVLLEKPMAPTAADCRRIEAAAARSAGLLSIGHVMHYYPVLMVARQLIDAGEIGRPVSASSRLAKLWMQSNRKPWHLDPATGGGMLMTAGIHALDQAVWLMDGRVASVTAMAGAFFHPQTADDTAHVGLRFTDGRIAQLSSIGYRGGASSSAIEICGETAVLAVDLRASTVRVGRGEAWTEIDVPGAAEGMDEAVSREWSAFAGAVAGGGPPPIAPAYGRHMVAIIDAVLKAEAQRREVDVED